MATSRPDVRQVQAGRRLVEHVEPLGGRAAAPSDAHAAVARGPASVRRAAATAARPLAYQPRLPLQIAMQKTIATISPAVSDP